MKKIIFLFLIFLFLLGTFFFLTKRKPYETQTISAQTTNYDWPQVGNNPQHTGYSSETLGTNFQIKWRKAFQPDKIYPQVQAIVYQGKVFVGTEGANGQKPTLYALNATTGSQVWKFETGGSILSSVAVDNGKVFIAAMDGAVYCVDANTGQQFWKNQVLWRHGFSVSPVIADNKILLGGRDGNFYALDLNDGHIFWQNSIGSPIYQTASSNNGRVFFGAMDMVFYALNTSDGSLSWKSQKTQGMAFKDYWPVIHQGRVFVRAMAISPQKNFYAFDENTGIESITLPQYDGQTMNGATTPPCVDRDERLVIPSNSATTTWMSGWGRLDLTTLQIEKLVDSRDPNYGYGNPDENLNPTCAQNLILSMHTEEMNANWTGYFNLDNRTWTRIYQGWVNPEITSNTQGGGGNQASIANGMVFHITYHQLVARTTQ